MTTSAATSSTIPDRISRGLSRNGRRGERSGGRTGRLSRFGEIGLIVAGMAIADRPTTHGTDQPRKHENTKETAIDLFSCFRAFVACSRRSFLDVQQIFQLAHELAEVAEVP